MDQEEIASKLAETTGNPVLRQLAEALGKSNRLMAEDMLRESGYMLPQSRTVGELLESLLSEKQPADFPEAAVKRLLELVNGNTIQGGKASAFEKIDY